MSPPFFTHRGTLSAPGEETESWRHRGGCVRRAFWGWQSLLQTFLRDSSNSTIAALRQALTVLWVEGGQPRGAEATAGLAEEGLETHNRQEDLDSVWANLNAERAKGAGIRTLVTGGYGSRRRFP